MARGDYEVMGHGDERTVTGECAGCGLTVMSRMAHCILYHPTERGGIFHDHCAPTGAGWYPVDDATAAGHG